MAGGRLDRVDPQPAHPVQGRAQRGAAERGGQQLPPGGQPAPGAVGDGRLQHPDRRGQAAQVGHRVGEGGRVDDQAVGDRGQLVEHLLVEGGRPLPPGEHRQLGQQQGQDHRGQVPGVDVGLDHHLLPDDLGPVVGAAVHHPGPGAHPLAALGRLGDQDHAARGGAAAQLLDRGQGPLAGGPVGGHHDQVGHAGPEHRPAAVLALGALALQGLLDVAGRDLLERLRRLVGLAHGRRQRRPGRPRAISSSAALGPQLPAS